MPKTEDMVEVEPTPKTEKKNMCNTCGKSFSGHHLRKWCNDCKKTIKRKVVRKKIADKEVKQEYVKNIDIKKINKNIPEELTGINLGDHIKIDVSEEKPVVRIKRSRVNKRESSFEEREKAKKKIEIQRTTVSSKETILKEKLKQLYKTKEDLETRLEIVKKLIDETNKELGKAGFARNCFGITYHDEDFECKECVKRVECKRLKKERDSLWKQDQTITS